MRLKIYQDLKTVTNPSSEIDDFGTDFTVSHLMEDQKISKLNQLSLCQVFHGNIVTLLGKSSRSHFSLEKLAYIFKIII